MRVQYGFLYFIPTRHRFTVYINLKVHKHEFFFTFLQKPNPYVPKGL